jgi:hypothetical protein
VFRCTSWVATTRSLQSERHCGARKPASLSRRCTVCGGVGKTTLAAAYAERHRGGYRATWWIRAQAEPALRADLIGMGIRLGWVSADEKEEPAVAAVMERLRDEGEGILLIFDNAVDANALKPHLPRGGRSHVLITSNAHAWRGVAAPIEIQTWSQEIGADYLLARTGRTNERAVAEALSQALGGLPLAHEQAAAYRERLEISLADYRSRFEAAPAHLLGDTRSAPAEYHDRLTVTKTFALAIDEAARPSRCRSPGHRLDACTGSGSWIGVLPAAD